MDSQSKTNTRIIQQEICEVGKKSRRRRYRYYIEGLELSEMEVKEKKKKTTVLINVEGISYIAFRACLTAK